jgi:hypothetical protein
VSVSNEKRSGGRSREELKVLANQRRVRAQLPLVAVSLNCGHLLKDYGLSLRDIVFCQECASMRQVKKVLAE